MMKIKPPIRLIGYCAYLRRNIHSTLIWGRNTPIWNPGVFLF